MHAIRFCLLAAASVAASVACSSSSENSASGTSLAFTVQPTGIAPGGDITPAVKVAILGSYGSTVTSSSAAVTVALGTNPGGTLSGTLTRNAVSGVATFDDLSIDNPGAGYTFVATSAGLTAATSGAFDVVSTGPSAPPAKVGFIAQPTPVVRGNPITPAVKVAVQDSNGVTVTGSTAAVTIGIGTNPGADTLSGTRTVNAVNGVATFASLSIDSVGTGYTLTAASTGLTGATSNAFDVSAPAPPTQLAFIQHPTTVGQGGAITPPVQVGVADSSGFLVPTSTAPITIALGTNPSNGAVTGTLTVNAVNGIATFANLHIDSAGTGYTLTAASPGLTADTSNAFNVTAPNPAPLAITITTQGIAYRSSQNSSINPAVDTLRVTGTATWTGLGLGTHLVRSTGSPSFTTQTVSATQYQFTFNTTGTYQYDCTVHGAMMTGQIEVVP